MYLSWAVAFEKLSRRQAIHVKFTSSATDAGGCGTDDDGFDTKQCEVD
jgi:hypothetical protein